MKVLKKNKEALNFSPSICAFLSFILMLGLLGCAESPWKEQAVSNLDIYKGPVTETMRHSLLAAKSAGNVIAVDKFFGGTASARETFRCLKTNYGATHYIATYNAGLKGGSLTDQYLEEALFSGMTLGVYFAYNSEAQLSDPIIAHFLETISQYDIVRVWIDIERPARDVHDHIKNFYNKVCSAQGSGYPCGVYTNFGGMGRALHPNNAYPNTPETRLFLSAMPLWFASDQLGTGGTLPHASVQLSNTSFQQRFIGSDGWYGWKKVNGNQVILDRKPELCYPSHSQAGWDFNVMEPWVTKRVL